MKNKICLNKSTFVAIILAVLAVYTVLNDINGFINGVTDALFIK